MLRSKYAKLIVAAVSVVMVLGLSACGGGAKVPDTYNYDDLTEYIKLGDYQGLEYTMSVAEVTDSDIQSYINKELSNLASTEDVKSGTVTAKDKVKIDFTGKIDGKEFDGGSATDYTLDIPNDSMIDGFSEGIVGHKVGDTFDENLKFPETYQNADVAGKDVVFTITVKAIVKDVTPEFNDQYVKDNTEYKTTAEYEKAVAKQLAEENTRKAKENVRKELFQKILKSSKVVKYPAAELASAKESMKETYQKLAEQYGMSYEDYLKNAAGTTEKEFDKQIDAYAENTVKQSLVLRALAKKLDISVSDSDYNDYLQGLLKDNGMDEDSFEDQVGMSLAEYAEQNNMYDAMLYEKVMDQVMELSKEK